MKPALRVLGIIVASMQFSCNPEKRNSDESHAVSGEMQSITNTAWAALKQSGWVSQKQEEYRVTVTQHATAEDSRHLKSITPDGPFHKIKNDLSGPLYVVTFSPKDNTMLGGGFYVFIDEKTMKSVGIVGAP